MPKIDFKKTLDSYKAKPRQFQRLDVPQMQYLMVDGHGDPGTEQSYIQAIEALYPMAYALKFASKQADRDYVVPPLSGLWWAEDMKKFTSERDKSHWDWTLMIMTPPWIDSAMFGVAREKVARKDVPALNKVRLESLREGECVQTLHLGSYEDEGPVLARMHNEFIPSHGLQMVGKHHEIYLSDPRRTPAEKLRTILRQPVAPRMAAE